MGALRSRVPLVLALMAVLAWMLAGCGKKPEPPGDQADLPPVSTRTPAEMGGTPPPPPPSGEGGAESAADTPDARAARAPLALADVHFPFDRYDLDAEARAILAGDARSLETRPDVKVLIEGHCDERGTVEYNLALGEKRAAAVREYLVDYGIDPARLSTVSFGESRPLDPAATEDAWAKNRRAHLGARER